MIHKYHIDLIGAIKCVAAISGMRAQSMAGIVALARALTIRFVSEDYQATGDLAANLAGDILRLQAAGTLHREFDL